MGRSVMHRGMLLLLVIGLLAGGGGITAQRGDDGGEGRDDGGNRGAVLSTPNQDQRTATPSPDEDTLDAEASTEEDGVSIVAADGVHLYGEYFPAGGSRAILLLHELYTNRASWYGVVEPLRSAGFSVLIVDLRGWGASRAEIHWGKAQDDTQAWLDWLADQDGVRSSGIYLMGTSMGANLALTGCLEARACAGAVAISPGRSYFGVYADAALSSGMDVLIAYAENDPYPRRDMPILTALDDFNADVLVYPGRAHGMALLGAQDDLLTEIITWLRRH